VVVNKTDVRPLDGLGPDELALLQHMEAEARRISSGGECGGTGAHTCSWRLKGGGRTVDATCVGRFKRTLPASSHPLAHMNQCTQLLGHYIHFGPLTDNACLVLRPPQVLQTAAAAAAVSRT
jgi:hypothetical protein